MINQNSIHEEIKSRTNFKECWQLRQSVFTSAVHKKLNTTQETVRLSGREKEIAVNFCQLLANVLKCLLTQIVYLAGIGGKETGINRRMSISTY